MKVMNPSIRFFAVFGAVVFGLLGTFYAGAGLDEYGKLQQGDFVAAHAATSNLLRAGFLLTFGVLWTLTGICLNLNTVRTAAPKESEEVVTPETESTCNWNNS